MKASNVELKELESKPELENVILPYRAQLDAKMNQVLCSNKNDMSKSRPESALGNFFADACTEMAVSNYEGTIDAALFNTGGIRSSLARGEITTGDIFQLMPFENELVVVELPYIEMVNLLNYLVRSGGEPISKMRIDIKDGKLNSATIDGQPLQERNYYILTSDYLSTGGDKMTFFTEGHRISIAHLGLKIRDVLIRTCEKLGQDDITLDYSTDGRIQD